MFKFRKPKKKGSIVLLLETKFQDFEAVVELPGVSCYYEVISCVLHVLDAYRSSSNFFCDSFVLEYQSDDETSHWSEMLPTVKFALLTTRFSTGGIFGSLLEVFQLNT
eukprot:TRINITY_DN6392_c0_g2_i9.p1 TRINITY_DN6392_c0_g2~~TRINITY_DN6392_c0_g2_i9.p1  ORF type:complete len:108 (-),score=14.99 TRINITY_DN6392_c0_g2_i9:43-366(-)